MYEIAKFGDNEYAFSIIHTDACVIITEIAGRHCTHSCVFPLTAFLNVSSSAIISNIFKFLFNEAITRGLDCLQKLYISSAIM